MTLLEQLQSHRGGLLHLKTELFWYDGRGHDNNPGRICLLLDAAAGRAFTVDVVTAATASAAPWRSLAGTAALLLIDGQPTWIWVDEDDIEVIDEAR